jgi:hypothetical protein
MASFELHRLHENHLRPRAKDYPAEGRIALRRIAINGWAGAAGQCRRESDRALVSGCSDPRRERGGEGHQQDDWARFISPLVLLGTLVSHICRLSSWSAPY